MTEYQFQYTKRKDNILVIIFAIAAFILTELFGIYIRLNVVLTISLGFGSAVFLFQLLKRKAVHTCNAKLYDTSVKFESDNMLKEINFTTLISFKSYYGKNGPVLYLTTLAEKFQLSANNNFCKTDDCKLFCDDLIVQLEKYKKMNNTIIVD